MSWSSGSSPRPKRATTIDPVSARQTTRHEQEPVATPFPIGIVSGSGIDLRGLLDEMTEEQRFAAVEGLGDGSVAGHACVFVHGRCADRDVVLQCGRLHAYEGLDYAAVTRPVDVLHAHGVRDVVLTNAVGGLRPEMAPGDWVAADAIRPWPYPAFALPGRIAPGFLLPGCDFVGPYMWMHGPTYETRAEIAMLQRLGGATVGMSAAPEVRRCHELGMRAAVVSCVTNSCCRPQVLTHDHVIRIAQRASAKLVALLREALAEGLGERT